MKQDFKIAEELNRQLAIPSDCFKLSFLPTVRYIVCADEVFSIQVAKLLKKNLQDFGCFTKIIVVPEFEILAKGELDTDKWWNLVSALSNFEFEAGCATLMNDVMLVGREEIARRAAEDVLLTDIKVAILERFMQKEDCLTRTLVACNGKSHGLMKLNNCDYLVIYGDDMEAVKASRQPWELLKRIYGDKGPSGQKRQMIHLGGKGVFSKLLYPYLCENGKALSEAALQHKTCCRIGCGFKDNIVLGNSNNIGDALKELARIIKDKSAIMVLPQRYSLMVRFSQLQQFSELNLSYLVMRESVAESCRYLNGMKFCQETPILHFWAHVLPRWEKYSKPQADGRPFMIPVFGVSDELRSEAAVLSRRYLLKQQTHSLRRYWQELRLRFELRRKGYLAAEDYRQMLCLSR